jgi:hypothetical protein
MPRWAAAVRVGLWALRAPRVAVGAAWTPRTSRTPPRRRMERVSEQSASSDSRAHIRPVTTSLTSRLGAVAMPRGTERGGGL